MLAGRGLPEEGVESLPEGYVPPAFCYSYADPIYGGCIARMADSSDSPRPQSTTAAEIVDVADPSSSASVSGGAACGSAVPPTAPPDPCATCRKRRRSCPKYAQDNKDDSSAGQPLYTLGEEIANSITHGIGVLLAIAGLVLLIVKAALGGADPTHIIS